MAKVLQYATVTGADERTDIDWMLEMSLKYRFLEWGLLVGSRLGPRYPDWYWIRKVLHRFADQQVVANFSLHLCSAPLRLLFGGEVTVGSVFVDSLGDALLEFDRIQLNCSVYPYSEDDKLRTARRLHDHFLQHAAPVPEVIIQQGSRPLDFQRLVGVPKLSVLFDTSGGRGLSGYTPAGRPGVKCGWAGGLSANRLVERLFCIREDVVVAPTPEQPIVEWWIDAEGKLRTGDDEDRLVPESVEQYLERVTEFRATCNYLDNQG